MEEEDILKGEVNVSALKKMEIHTSVPFKKRSHPTRCLKIGQIKCLFLSCYKGGRAPILSIGPSWPFTFVIIGFAFLVLFYFLFMINMIGEQLGPKIYILYSGLAVNLLVLFTGILKNPGIPQ